MSSEIVTLNMDGREVSAPAGTTLLQVARRNGIPIPTLCYHEAVSAYGGCRLCLVELVRDSRSKLVVSCLYEVEPGLVVKTNSERVRDTRRMILDLLLAQCPHSEVIQDLAREYGLEKSSFPSPDENNLCMLCGLCVRACQEVVGVNAISLVDRGTNREVSTPFSEPSQTCIGCGSCV
ncbi:MAG: 2Fe-2S iron-sulfur cluster-binding protein, partial [Chloroflexota bacterium]|nr:2Fe-2S iron-sulfur cluster-binding protein [Chloroflexota bacterium]